MLLSIDGRLGESVGLARNPRSRRRRSPKLPRGVLSLVSTETCIIQNATRGQRITRDATSCCLETCWQFSLFISTRWTSWRYSQHVSRSQGRRDANFCKFRAWCLSWLGSLCERLSSDTNLRLSNDIYISTKIDFCHPESPACKLAVTLTPEMLKL